jgi:hypothetical protein
MIESASFDNGLRFVGLAALHPAPMTRIITDRMHNALERLPFIVYLTAHLSFFQLPSISLESIGVT